MLGFHSISEAPFSSLAEEEASVINSLKLPVEIISSIEAISNLLIPLFFISFIISLCGLVLTA